MGTAGRLAWSAWLLCVLVAAVGLVLLVVNGPVQHALTVGSPVLDGLIAVASLAYPTIGAAIASREPRNAIGWVFIGAGLGNAVEDTGAVGGELCGVVRRTVAPSHVSLWLREERS